MRILFVDHAYHKATKSSAFFVELLRKSFKVDVFRYDRCYRVSIPREKIDWSDVIVYWEFLPSRFRIAEPGKRCVFVPMYDNEWDSRWQWRRIADSGMAVVSFCGRVTEHARKYGVKNLLDVRYALPPSPAPDDSRVAVLWERGQIGIDQIRKLFAPGDLDKLILVRRPAPGQVFPPVPEDFRKDYHVELHEGGYLPDEEYRAILSEPGIYVSPRFKEGIGMSFLEALAAGKFVVAHKDATMDEAVEDGVNGRLVDMRNPARIVLPATDPATRLAKAEERYARWKEDEERILAFFAALDDRPLCPSPWTIQSVVCYVRFAFEGISMRLRPGTD